MYGIPAYFRHQHETNRGCFPIIASVQPDNRHVAYIIPNLGNYARNRYNERRFEAHLCLSINVNFGGCEWRRLERCVGFMIRVGYQITIIALVKN